MVLSHFGLSINSATLETCYFIIIIILILNPRKTRVGKNWKSWERMERLMFLAVVQLKTVVQQNRIETK